MVTAFSFPRLSPRSNGHRIRSVVPLPRTGRSLALNEDDPLAASPLWLWDAPPSVWEGSSDEVDVLAAEAEELLFPEELLVCVKKLKSYRSDDGIHPADNLTESIGALSELRGLKSLVGRQQDSGVGPEEKPHQSPLAGKQVPLSLHTLSHLKKML